MDGPVDLQVGRSRSCLLALKLTRRQEIKCLIINFPRGEPDPSSGVALYCGMKINGHNTIYFLIYIIELYYIIDVLPKSFQLFISAKCKDECDQSLGLSHKSSARKLLKSAYITQYAPYLNYTY